MAGKRASHGQQRTSGFVPYPCSSSFQHPPAPRSGWNGIVHIRRVRGVGLLSGYGAEQITTEIYSAAARRGLYTNVPESVHRSHLLLFYKFCVLKIGVADGVLDRHSVPCTRLCRILFNVKGWGAWRDSRGRALLNSIARCQI
jgi:hypothetical protein